jgi:hypothetical protein
MSSRKIIDNIGSLLEEFGFIRSGNIWNRNGDNFIDCVDVQFSKADKFSINIGCLYVPTYRFIWDREMPITLDTPFCTVNTRLSSLVSKFDIWWPLNFSGVLEANSLVAERGIPFLDSLHDLSEMYRWLSMPSGSRKGPLEKLNLGVLCYLTGRIDISNKIFASFEESENNSWKERAKLTLDRLKGAVIYTGSNYKDDSA